MTPSRRLVLALVVDLVLVVAEATGGCSPIRQASWRPPGTIWPTPLR